MTSTASKIPYLINRFEKAVRAHEMRGAAHPLERAHIEEQYNTSKKALKTFMVAHAVMPIKS